MQNNNQSLAQTIIVVIGLLVFVGIICTGVVRSEQIDQDKYNTCIKAGGSPQGDGGCKAKEQYVVRMPNPNE